MTGTPIENRLADLWSLFDFLNPGLLGTAKEFTQFTKRLRSDTGGYARLKRVVNPYILRRLKTDKTIISDLPDKVEMKTYASLSKKQIVLYHSLVGQLKAALEEKPEGIQRRGLVLASLMKFKQLCNHPDQYTGQGHFDEAHSGKFQQLRAICETIHDKREKVLVFTQFKEIIDPLAAYLESLFEHSGLVLHGGTAVKKRKTLVDRFQSNAYVPFMILSLKAGGVGLNLTAANHVIHFDRWWNPAVENQATDRAFRIGQHRNVVVHKFITQGTVEEKIDVMLTEKAELADQVISATGEQWITEMDKVDVTIKAIRKQHWRQLKEAAAQKLGSLQQILDGRFPKALAEIFTAPGKGLFPTPKEIAFDCSCPDWADMCKHVAATLYGIGARLDEDPSLFFMLRKVDVHDLVTEAVKDQSEKLIKQSKRTSKRVMKDTDLADVFGIDIDTAPTSPPCKTKAKTTTKKVRVKKTIRKKATPKKKKVIKKKVARKKVAKKTTRRKKAVAKTHRKKRYKNPTKKDA